LLFYLEEWVIQVDFHSFTVQRVPKTSSVLKLVVSRDSLLVGLVNFDVVCAWSREISHFRSDIQVVALGRPTFKS